jgi:hypothetical protein
VKKIIRCLVLISVFSTVKAQQKGDVKVIMSPEIENLIKRDIALNEANQTIEGFRVQIHFGGERAKAQDIKAKFLKQFPETGAYESYQQPNFRVRVGDFRTKLEAQKFLRELAGTFPSAFVVADGIQLPKLPEN